jgi:hypothetical protein
MIAVALFAALLALVVRRVRYFKAQVMVERLLAEQARKRHDGNSFLDP